MPHKLSSTRFQSLLQRQVLYGVMALILVTLWGMIAWFSTQQRQRLLEESQRELSHMNGAVAQHVAGLLKTMETDLRVLDLWLQSHPDADPLTDARFIAMVDALRDSADGLIDVRAVSAEGQLHPLPAPDHQPRADVKDREYFKAAIAKGAPGLHVGVPIVGRIKGKWILPVAWRLAAPAKGVSLLVANVELEKLAAIHERLRLKPEGAITLVRQDGVLLSRAPFEPKFVGMDFTRSPLFLEGYAARPQGTFFSDSSITDGVRRIVSFERLPAYPVIVLVSRGEREVLDVYFQRRAVVVGIAATLSLLLMGFTVALRHSLTALHVAQRKLLELAATDDLTGLMNRRALLHRSGQELSRAKRFGRPMAVALLDIDHFKKINDTHGHHAGDVVLQQCAGLWKPLLRNQDLLGRMGGEEFCVVLIETEAQGAALAIERLRAATAGYSFQLPDSAEPTGMTISIGWTTVREDDEWPSILARADGAMYIAKARGRNCVCRDTEAP